MSAILFLLVKSGPLQGHKYLVKSDALILIGRSEEAHIRIGYDDFCSRRHAEVFWQDNRCFIRDLSSTNGTFVNNAKIKEPRVLINHDLINLGSTDLMVMITESESKKQRSEDDASYE